MRLALEGRPWARYSREPLASLPVRGRLALSASFMHVVLCHSAVTCTHLIKAVFCEYAPSLPSPGDQELYLPIHFASNSTSILNVKRSEKEYQFLP